MTFRYTTALAPPRISGDVHAEPTMMTRIAQITRQFERGARARERGPGR